MFSMVIFTINSTAQVRSYSPSQTISIGGGETLKVLQTKGEGPQQECELQHYVKNKPVGNRFWLTANGIAMQQNARRPKPAQPKLAVPEAKFQAVIVKREAVIRTSIEQKKAIQLPDNPPLMVHSSTVENPVATAVKETIQPEPTKKIKKEFVSHNPFLSPQYRGNQTAGKKSVDSSKVN
jgi:hypothetical protein